MCTWAIVVWSLGALAHMMSPTIAHSPSTYEHQTK